MTRIGLCLDRLKVKNRNTPVTVKFFFDFASPWSFLGCTQIESALAETKANVKLEYVPILLGALLKKNEIEKMIIKISFIFSKISKFNIQSSLEWKILSLNLF